MSNIPLKQYWGLMYKYLRPQWKISLVLAILLLGNIALQLVNPQIIRSFIDAAQAGAATERLVRAALLFLGLAVIIDVGAYAGGGYGNRGLVSS